MFVMDFYLGIDLGGTGLKIGITDPAGRIVYKQTFPTSVQSDPDRMVKDICACIAEVIGRSGAAGKKIVAAGIGSPGALNPLTGQLIYVVNLQMLNGYYLSPAIEKATAIPTFLDNDVNAMALGELFYGAARGYKHVIALTLGTGIGGGIIVDGKLYRGATFTAGELGHVTIDSNGLLCNCGNYGCIERYAGRDGIVNRFNAYYVQKKMASAIVKHLDNGEITPRAIAEAANAGDRLACMVLEETGELLGVALATMVNFMNPELIVIGGGIANAGDLILEPARREMHKRAYTLPAQAVRIVQAQLKNDAGIIGSASVAVDAIKNKT
jgi:glucokinase